MADMSERDIQDFLNKVAVYLEDIPSDIKQPALEEWRSATLGYLRAHQGADIVRIHRLLGGPRVVANSIRLRTGHALKGSRAQSTRQAVAMVLGVGSLFMLVLVGVLWWKFTPILSVEQSRVQVLGGLIDIDNRLGQVKVGDSFEFSDTQYKNVFEGSYDIPDEIVEDVLLEFDRGQMELSYVDSNRISWECKISSEPSDGFITQEKELVTISLKKSGGADCTFKMPVRLKYTINGDAGKVDIIVPANDTFIQLGSGLVLIHPDSELSYRFDIRVGQGMVDPAFAAISQEGGIEVKVDVGTGSVEKKN